MPYLHAPEDLGEVVGDGPSYRVDQLRDWLYHTPVLQAQDMTNLPGDLRASLAESLWPFSVEIEQNADGGTTRKWLFRAPDGAAIEAVLMGYPRRTTLCISSQAGCALACTFCATGQFGFERHLEPGEIVAQVAYAQAFLRQIGMPGVTDHVTNIVFMGMGEPSHQYTFKISGGLRSTRTGQIRIDDRQGAYRSSIPAVEQGRSAAIDARAIMPVMRGG